MPPSTAERKGAEELETGLLSTAEEDRTLILQATPLSKGLLPPPTSVPVRNMAPVRRLTVAAAVGLFLGLGLCLAKDPTARACLNRHGLHPLPRDAQQPTLISELAGLAKRQTDGSGSNATASGNAPTTQLTTSSSLESTPTTSTAAASDAPTTAATSTAASASTTTPDSITAPSVESSSSASSSSQDAPSSTSPETASVSSPQSSSSDNTPESMASSTYKESSETPMSTSASSSATPPRETSSAEETTSSSSPTSTLRIITTGKVSTSSAVLRTFTRTAADGGLTVVTGTSWVVIVPSSVPVASSGSEDPSLQNAASRIKGPLIALAAAVGAVAAGIVLA